MRIRQQGRFPRPAQTILLVCLYSAAWNAKVMAVTLPVLIGVYELLYHRGKGRRSRSVTISALGVITGAAVYLLQMQSFLNDLIYSLDWFNDGRTLALLAVLFAIAWLSRNRDLKFCWWFLTIGVVPIAFIAPSRAIRRLHPDGWAGHFPRDPDRKGGRPAS